MSAWAPPNKNAWYAMAKAFPKLTFHLRYAEKGCQFCGESIATEGKFLPDESYCISVTSYMTYDEENEKYIYKHGINRFEELFEKSG